MAALVYEVLVHCDIPTRLGAKGRWYLGSAHPDLGGAERAFRALDLDYPSPKVTIALVRSEHDPATGLFVDRIVKARGRVPVISRARLARLDPAARAELARAAGSAPEPQREIALAAPTPGQPGRPQGLTMIVFVAATLALFAALGGV